MAESYTACTGLWWKSPDLPNRERRDVSVQQCVRRAFVRVSTRLMRAAAPPGRAPQVGAAVHSRHVRDQGLRREECRVRLWPVPRVASACARWSACSSMSMGMSSISSLFSLATTQALIFTIKPTSPRLLALSRRIINETDKRAHAQHQGTSAPPLYRPPLLQLG